MENDTKFVAFGLSLDKEMGDDSVVACTQVFIIFLSILGTLTCGGFYFKVKFLLMHISFEDISIPSIVLCFLALIFYQKRLTP